MASFSPKKKLTTQQTFDSNDDLLDNEEGLDDENEETPTRHEKAENNDISIWDCRVVHWPPHSAKSVVKYVFDYVKSPFLILEVLLLAVFLFLCYKMPAFMFESHHRPIPIQTTATGETLIDLTFANAYAHPETIPGSMLNILCVYIPIGIFAVLGIFFGPRDDTHAAICAYLFAMASKIFIVSCIKQYAGYLRPSFYNMCQFNPETLLCDDETTSARESFPSGHAATALSSMTLLALYLLGKVCGGTKQRGVKAERRGESHDEIWTPSLAAKVLAVASVTPVLLGMFIATSRVRDNWHHPADVLCGGVIGACCSSFAHSLWYPSVYSHYGGIPLTTVAKIVAERRKPKAAPRVQLDLDDMDVEG